MVRVIGVRLSDELLRVVDVAVAREGFSSRSEFIRYLIRSYGESRGLIVTDK